MANPSEGIRDLLVAADVGEFNVTKGWNIVISRIIDDPNTLIVIYDSGGQSPNPQWLVNYPSVQVRVRGGANDYTATRAKCREIQDALLGLNSQDINGDRWVSITQLGDINWVGYDSNNRPQFTLNFRLIIEPPEGTHRESL